MAGERFQAIKISCKIFLSVFDDLTSLCRTYYGLVFTLLRNFWELAKIINKGLPINQGFHKLFAYGCPDRGREFDKKREKENLKRLNNIFNEY